MIVYFFTVFMKKNSIQSVFLKQIERSMYKWCVNMFLKLVFDHKLITKRTITTTVFENGFYRTQWISFKYFVFILIYLLVYRLSYIYWCTVLYIYYKLFLFVGKNYRTTYNRLLLLWSILESVLKHRAIYKPNCWENKWVV